MIMTLDQLRIFLAVVTEGSMTRAADRLNMTQSAVSAAIAALETRSQLRLFDRIGRGLSLSPEGRAFVPAAEAVLARADIAQMLLTDLACEPRGRLRIHASQTVSNYWLPSRLVRLHKAHPGIEIAVEVGNTTQVARAIHDGSSDIGFVEGDVAHDDLLRRVIARDELVLVASADNPILAKPQLDREDYTQLVWVLREQGSGTRSEFEAHLAQMELSVQDLTVAFEIPSNEAVLAAVAAGDYVTMISRRAAGRSLGLGLRSVDWAPVPHRAFSALIHPDRHRTRAIESMWALLDTDLNETNQSAK